MAGFSKGDVVQLKSGGPAMTVEDMGDYSEMGLGPKDGVKCVWFSGSQRQHHIFDAATIDKIAD